MPLWLFILIVVAFTVWYFSRAWKHAVEADRAEARRDALKPLPRRVHQKAQARYNEGSLLPWWEQ